MRDQYVVHMKFMTSAADHSHHCTCANLENSCRCEVNFSQLAQDEQIVGEPKYKKIWTFLDISCKSYKKSNLKLQGN